MIKVVIMAMVFVMMLIICTSCNQHSLKDSHSSVISPDIVALIEADGTVEIDAQDSPYYGRRTIKVYVTFPNKTIKSVTGDTGLFLSLHNWGGTNSVGTADPCMLAQRYNVVAICVDYLQSGMGSPPAGGHPYDLGYLQALDALRAIYYVYNGLEKADITFNKKRIYVCGGSGGGNVALMTNKLAPRTFACLFDLSGVPYLSDDIAFNLPGGSSLNANYSQTPNTPNYLSKDEQVIRDPGDERHLDMMKKLGNECTVVVCHGNDDDKCLVVDKKRIVANMQKVGIIVDAYYISKNDVDGDLIKFSGHGIGDPTRLLIHFADQYFACDSNTMRRTNNLNDFDLRDEKVLYQTPQGVFEISYKSGYPVGRFIEVKQ